MKPPYRYHAPANFLCKFGYHNVVESPLKNETICADCGIKGQPVNKHFTERQLTKIRNVEKIVSLEGL